MYKDLTPKDLEEAKSFWENHLLPLLEHGSVKPYPTPDAIMLLAHVIKKKVIGSFDELMTDKQVTDLVNSNCAMEQARRELVGCHHRLNEMELLKSKPPHEHVVKVQFQAIQRIAKILTVDE